MHSIRLGACATLRSSGNSGKNIKLRLRLCSDAFMMYIINIIALAERPRDIIRNE